MGLLNETTTSGYILALGVTNIFGSYFVFLLVSILLLIALSFAFKIPIELTVPIIAPLILVGMAFTTEMMTLGGLSLIYMAIIFVKMFFL